MKYNLKMLKQLINESLEQTDSVGIDPKFEEWFEGFKKELRQLLLSAQKTVDGEGWTWKQHVEAEVYIEIIREILGEAEK